MTFGAIFCSPVVSSNAVVSPYTISELVGSSISHSMVTPVEVGVDVRVPGIIVGSVLSISSPVVAVVFVFPDESVMVIVSFGVFTSPVPVPTVPVHTTSPLAVAGFGVHIIFGIITVVPGSTHVTVVVIVVPLFAGFGLVVAVGVVGSVVSISTGPSHVVVVGPFPVLSKQSTFIVYIPSFQSGFAISKLPVELRVIHVPY